MTIRPALISIEVGRMPNRSSLKQQQQQQTTTTGKRLDEIDGEGVISFRSLELIRISTSLSLPSAVLNEIRCVKTGFSFGD